MTPSTGTIDPALGRHRTPPEHPGERERAAPVRVGPDRLLCEGACAEVFVAADPRRAVNEALMEQVRMIDATKCRCSRKRITAATPDFEPDAAPEGAVARADQREAAGRPAVRRGRPRVVSVDLHRSDRGLLRLAVLRPHGAAAILSNHFQNELVCTVMTSSWSCSMLGASSSMEKLRLKHLHADLVFLHKREVARGAEIEEMVVRRRGRRAAKRHRRRHDRHRAPTTAGPRASSPRWCQADLRRADLWNLQWQGLPAARGSRSSRWS